MTREKTLIRNILFATSVVILLILSIPEEINNSSRLNQFSIDVIKQSLANKTQNSIVDEIPNPEKMNCRMQWISFRMTNKSLGRGIDTHTAKQLINCSSLYVSFLYRIYPTVATLAQYAVNAYPSMTVPLYWLSASIDPKITPEYKYIYEKILELNPHDGLAWRYMGVIYLAEGKISEAIQAHINCCFNGDPGVNGCWNAGRLYEQEGQYEEAIYYYRQSRWQTSREAADRLEAQIASGEIKP